MSKKNNNKGFTLAELLIVVAIIAVLVAIAIPVFTKRLEQSRETTDLANLRSAYAAGQVAVMSGIGTSKPNDLSGNTFYFNPNDEYGLTNNVDNGAKIGQGTAVDGAIELSNVPKIISEGWKGDKDVRGDSIQVSFDASGIAKLGFTKMLTTT